MKGSSRATVHSIRFQGAIKVSGLDNLAFLAYLIVSPAGRASGGSEVDDSRR